MIPRTYQVTIFYLKENLLLCHDMHELQTDFICVYCGYHGNRLAVLPAGFDEVLINKTCSF